MGLPVVGLDAKSYERMSKDDPVDKQQPSQVNRDEPSRYDDPSDDSKVAPAPQPDNRPASVKKPVQPNEPTQVDKNKPAGANQPGCAPQENKRTGVVTKPAPVQENKPAGVQPAPNQPAKNTPAKPQTAQPAPAKPPATANRAPATPRAANAPAQNRPVNYVAETVPKPKPMVCRRVDIYFGANQTSFSDKDVAAIDSLATCLKAHPNETVRLEGRNDTKETSSADEMPLARRRARALADELTKRGVNESQLRTMNGPSQCIGVDNPNCLDKNRSVSAIAE